jgi:hypothetical protein
MVPRLLYSIKPGERIPYRVFYHVTAKKNLKNIQKSGIKLHKSKWKEEKCIYLTDKRGAGVIAKYWIKCNNNPVVLRVKIPENWLEYFNGIGYDYMHENPYALEWVVSRDIPPEYITDVFDFKGC